MTELGTVEQAGHLETEEIHENMHSIHYANVSQKELTGNFKDDSQASSSLDLRNAGQTFRDAVKFQGASGGATTMKMHTGKTDGKVVKQSLRVDSQSSKERHLMLSKREEPPTLGGGGEEPSSRVGSSHARRLPHEGSASVKAKRGITAINTSKLNEQFGV